MNPNEQKFEFSGIGERTTVFGSGVDDPYLIPPALAGAVKVALTLGMPLLLTGKPGTGKTRLAYKLAKDLHSEFKERFLPVPLIFNTKTGSSYNDLFYSYDALGHFRAANFPETVTLKKGPLKTSFIPHETQDLAASYIQLQALGTAVLLSAGIHDSPYLPDPRLNDDTIAAEGPVGSVVLIDEIDKAPRDFTNDLLNEIEFLRFTVREDHQRPFEAGEGRIVIIMTSNSERALPDAFLRRCVFFHIDPPDDLLLRRIVLARVFPDKPGDRIMAALDDYLAFYNRLAGCKLKKEPSTAELLSWLFYLQPDIRAGKGLWQVDRMKLDASLGLLAKQNDDLDAVKAILYY